VALATTCSFWATSGRFPDTLVRNGSPSSD
jgi:hypothetical protein